MEVNSDTPKLTNMIIARFGQMSSGMKRFNDKAKVASEVDGIECGFLYFGKLLFVSDEETIQFT